MKLAASQISWKPENQHQALEIMQRLGFSGMEIAPTMAVGPEPYDKTAEAAVYAAEIYQQYGLKLCSMQSIWYGQAGSMFGAEREYLLEYTKAAVRFAKAAGIYNLVFGCPKNRIRQPEEPEQIAVDFFRELGGYAASQNCTIALEANPEIYGTNFMNTTLQALNVVDEVNSPGCTLNLDFGTMVQNSEPVSMLKTRAASISHVHISEPYLVPLQTHARHKQLAALLREVNYGGYVSIEMKQQPIEEFERAAEYLAEVFG